MRRRIGAVLLLAVVSAFLPAGRSSALVPCEPVASEIELWRGTHLRGANVFQGRNPGGGPGGFGDGAFSQTDFDDLRAAGANYVQISHAGLFAEQAPYALDPAAQTNLDNVLSMVAASGLYAVIAFRSGPGRSEDAITGEDYDQPIWTSQQAQDSWVQMVRHAAQRYASSPVVVGYSVMVEPNAYAAQGFPDPETFYAEFGGTLRDVNGLYAAATAAIRLVDPNTPILLEPEGFGNVNWVPYLRVTGDARTVYTAHDYTPFRYTHSLKRKARYPGRYDVDGDGRKERVDRSFLAGYLATLTNFSSANGVPVALTEFGVRRTARKAHRYLRDRVQIQDPIGNWAVWTWQPKGFNDPFSVHDPSKVHDVVVEAWAANCNFPAL